MEIFLLNVVLTKVFDYLYVIATCLKGACVCVFKRKTIRMYKEKISSALNIKSDILTARLVDLSGNTSLKRVF